MIRQAEDDPSSDSRLCKQIDEHRENTGQRLKAAIRDLAGPLKSSVIERRYQNRKRRALSTSDADEAWICDIMDMLREKTGPSVRSIAEKLANEPADSGWRNPAFGLPPEWIADRYWNRKDYERASDRRFQQNMAELAEIQGVKCRLGKK